MRQGGVRMRSVVRLVLMSLIALAAVLGPSPKAALAACFSGWDPNEAQVGPFDICCPGSYGFYCSSWTSNQTWFCDDACQNCVLVTDPEPMPTINSKC